MRSFTAANGATVTVDGGRATSDNELVQNLVDAVIADLAGQFSNDEIYEDGELSLAEYLSKELAGGPVS